MKINTGRLILGGIIASVICFMTDGMLHELVIKEQWWALFDALHATPTGHDPLAFLYFAIFELGRGFSAMFLYALLRGGAGPGVKTAALAGTASWFAYSLTGPVQMLPLGLFSLALWG